MVLNRETGGFAILGILTAAMDGDNMSSRPIKGDTDGAGAND